MKRPTKTKRDPEPLSWTPRSLPGGVYCSPACGGGCTRAAYEHAKQAAGNLARAMGAGWVPRVWENLGWHWSALYERDGVKVAEVYPSKHGGTAWCEVYVAGHQYTGEHWSPRKAFENVVKAIRDDVAAILADVERL